MKRPATTLRGDNAIALAAAACLAAGAPAAAAPGSESQVERVSQDVTTATAVQGDLKQKGVNFLIVPLPVVDPAVGKGLTLATGLFYSPVKGGRPWVTGIGVLYTSNKDWALGVAQQADLLDGRLRLAAGAGYGDFKLDFFGIGQNAGSQGLSIRLDEKGLFALFNGLYKVAGPLYAGVRYRFLSVDSRLAEPLFPDHPVIPNAELKTKISGLGPSADFDTRNSEFTPTKGAYITGQWLFDGSGVGSDFSYSKATLAANGYLPITKKTVLALRGSVCDSSHGAPFYDLCFFGSQHDLRGYEGGRYRDHAMGAAQAELRQALFGRFGAVVFVGVGGVAPSMGELWAAKALPSVGGGLRFQPVKKIPVNVSVDYAWGRGSQGLYLYIGEAF